MKAPVIHKTVLLQESIQGLDIKEGEIFLDGTLGGGGHSLEACGRVGAAGLIIGLDADREAILRSRTKFDEQKKSASISCRYEFVESNFRNLDQVLAALGIEKVDKILLDLGLSSQEIEDSGRGFSFLRNEPLLMTFRATPQEDTLTAAEIVNTWEEENIATIITAYGEERYARRIAKAIVESRAIKKIETTFDLVDIIKAATPRSYHTLKIHPATRTFQALRMTVNDEVGALQEALQKGFDRLNISGRYAVISFHSIEDRIVKHFFKTIVAQGGGQLITKKPIIPTQQEIQENPRARSAKLRIILKI